MEIKHDNMMKIDYCRGLGGLFLSLFTELCVTVAFLESYYNNMIALELLFSCSYAQILLQNAH